MKSDEIISTIFDEFEASVRAGERPDLGEFVRRAPAGHEASVCSQLISTALSIDGEQSTTPWIDTYLCKEMWQCRRQVCQALTALLYSRGGRPLANRLGVAEFGDYEARSVIGFGGFGTVFRATHKDDRQKVVAVKLSHREPNSNILLKNEKSVLESLGERLIPAIPRVIGWDGNGERHLIVDWIDGQPLDCWRNERTSPADLLVVVRQLCDIVQTLHNVGCCHGDLSPSNIMVSRNRQRLMVQLVDFGNAKKGWQPKRLETITRRYAAPELLRDKNANVTLRSDMWSLGVIIFEVLSGRHPFDGIPDTASNEEWLKHLEDGPVSTFGSPPALWRLLCGCFSPDPGQRLSDCRAGQLAQAIPSLGEYSSALATLPRTEHSVEKSGSRAAARGTTLRGQVLVGGALKLAGLLLLLFCIVGSIWLAAVGWSHKGSPVGTAQRPTTVPDSGIAPLPSAVPAPSGGLATDKPKHTTTSPDDLFSPTLGMQFRQFKPVKYMIGSPSTEQGRTPEEDQRMVILWRTFYLSVYDVTRRDFAKYMGDEGRPTTAEENTEATLTWKHPGFEQTDLDPVVMVSWLDAQEFCKWLSKRDGRHYRLPLESEWEYACRGGAKNDSPFGTGAELTSEQANISTDAIHPRRTTPVGSYEPNAFGLFDMHGNVFQWCYTSEPDRAFNDVMYPDQQFRLELDYKRIFRGGSWRSQAIDTRSAHRDSDRAESFAPDRGFRIVLDPDVGRQFNPASAPAQ